MTSTFRQRQQCSEYTFDASDEQLSAEFRHRIGLLPDEERDLSDAFKQQLGLTSPGEEPNGIDEIAAPVASHDVEQDATINRIKFEKFIKSSYQTKTSHVFVKSPMTQPLLAKNNEVDRQGSLVVSNAIKRFCGDIPVSPSTSKQVVGPARVSPVNIVISQLELLAKRPNSEPTSVKDTPLASSKRTSLKKLFSNSASGSSNGKLQSAGDQAIAANSGATSLDADILSGIPTTEFELAQFIVAYGILREELRDEIYCQLCAQVTSNPSAGSCSKGWVLHALCAACFMPSNQLLKYFFGFLNDAAQTEYGDMTMQIKRFIHRTNEKGPRFHPPSWIEYQAIKSCKSVMLPVLLADGRSETVEADSATTAAEMSRKIAASIGLRDRFGFAIYISVFDKVSSLGQGSDHVMDAISECEQLVSDGKKDHDVTGSQWQLFYRKEIFTPWHDVMYDDVCTELIYKQIVQGVLTSEYRLRSEDEFVRFVARRLYVEHGERLVPGLVQTKLHELLPQSLLSSGKSREAWTQSILTSFDQMGFSTKKHSIQQVKWAVVESGKRKWPLHFSGLFEAYCVQGPSLPKNDIVIAVSCRGVFLLEEPYKVLFGVHFYELVEVKLIRSLNGRGPGLTLITVIGEQWTFHSPNAGIIARLLTSFLDGLRRRSRWAVAIEDFLLQDHTKLTTTGRQGNVFQLSRGDVVELLDETSQTSLKPDWMYGRLSRTGVSGAFPYDCVYIIPTCERPPEDFLAIFTEMSSSNVSQLPRKRAAVVLASQTIGRHAGHGVQSAA